MRLQDELNSALETFERAPDWAKALPIENSDRIIAQRVKEAAARGFNGEVVIDVAAPPETRHLPHSNERDG